MATCELRQLAYVQHELDESWNLLANELIVLSHFIQSRETVNGCVV